MENLRKSVDKLALEGDLTDDEFLTLLSADESIDEYLFQKAAAVRQKHYESDIYIRGLIEFTNYCKNDCFYCGIRRSNKNAERYRLTREEILLCAKNGHDLGFRTFVLQGGEDAYFNDEKLADIVRSLKEKYPDSAVTLSIGERTRESYQKLFDAGADRYLLRHETADIAHYNLLHPPEMSYENRVRCLKDLKEIGYQVGAGMMIGSPYQTKEHLLADIRFLQKFKPDMVGIGPFIPHHDTEYKDQKAGSLKQTLRLLSIIRLILPKVLLPATTALGTISPTGREQGILAGANVIMPNLSPKTVRKKYLLYDNKICTGDEAAECISCLTRRVQSVGCRIKISRGDAKK